MDSFGKRLRELRRKADITQRELGEILNVTDVAVGKWENNTRSPDKDVLIKLAEYFDVSVDYLLCRTSIKNNVIFQGEHNGDIIEIEFKDKDLKFTQAEIQEMINELSKVGFDPTQYSKQ